MTGTPPGRQTFAVIDTAALRHNFAQIRARVPAEVGILAVVKANAYGHGAPIVAPVLEQAGATAFGVATIGEAVELRNAGINQPIVVLAGVGGRDIAAVQSHRISVTLTHPELAAELGAAARGHRLRVHLKIDSGMGRLGATPAELPHLLDAVVAAGNLDVEGVFSHFGDADNVFTPHCEGQVAAFHAGLEIVGQRGWTSTSIWCALESRSTGSRPRVSPASTCGPSCAWSPMSFR